MDVTVLGAVVAILSAACGLLASVWTLRGWFSTQFSKLYDKIDKVESNILNKLEYHERHDDERFGRVSDRIWELKVGLSKKDAIKRDNNGS